MDLKSVRIIQVTCPKLSYNDLEDPIHETTLERLFMQVKGTFEMSSLKNDGFFTDEEEARREVAARLRIQRDLLDKQIIENDVAIAKLREAQRGSPVRPVKTKK